ncbi:chemotaxis protein CheW [Desulfonema magnum]|uniref:Chemotaxis protein n=1 Tax=Desulfonema magnum TaxID=45655 RepID=A0A975GNJ4_9BACT|nr:chemotaxis protein CheW [Desulfonema magnum]QTA88031.1 Chemotaxis protein [Desulfonema magnum]
MPETDNEVRNGKKRSENTQSSVLSSQLSDERQLVVFRLVEEEFGVEIENVKEIVRLPDITPVPRSPDYVAGICNLRGNVLPVIDTRTRFALDPQESTDHTRLLVVETGGVQTSLVVDSVREVMRMLNMQEEPPPPVCRGIDRQFLSGVVKADSGERLILKLNLDEVLASDMEADAEGRETSDHQADMSPVIEGDTAAEEQLVSFKVAQDEYAFDIDKVSEIINITEITAVPNVPSYVRGLFTIRNHLLPIIDLRELLGLPSLISERHDAIDRAVKRHGEWAENLKHVVEAGAHFTGNMNPKETVFGIWLETYKTSSIEIEAIIKRLKKNRWELYNSGAEVLELRKTSKPEAMAFFSERISPQLKIVTDIMAELKSALEGHILEDQRALMVESDSMTIGYLVDWVDEVLRIPISVIDETPVVASSGRKEVKAVAKLNKGERLIMIMDESALVSRETSRALSEQIRKEEAVEKGDAKDSEKKSLAQQTMDEEQLVTFTINTEEYGIRIMQVQEINRITEITTVPRAPYFVDGMTNLRGNVIPVINIRKLFALEDRDVEDRTRIIIVDIGGNKTGLRVDQVNEVLRFSKRDIEKTPKIVIAGGVNKYMEGVCKIDHGKRMVVLLNMEKILDEKELMNLSEIVKESVSGQNHMTESFSKNEAPPEKTQAEEAKLDETEKIKLEKPAKKKLEIAE